MTVTFYTDDECKELLKVEERPMPPAQGGPPTSQGQAGIPGRRLQNFGGNTTGRGPTTGGRGPTTGGRPTTGGTTGGPGRGGPGGRGVRGRVSGGNTRQRGRISE